MSPTKIMLLGTFHFEDAGLDAYKPQYKLDMASTEKQAEIEKVRERLAAFQPTHILLERRAEFQQKTHDQYQAYLRGEFELTANEIHQLGFRLAQRLGHSTVYSIDSWGRYYDPPLDLEKVAGNRPFGELVKHLETMDFDPEQAMTNFANTHDQSHLLKEWADYFQELYEGEDKKKAQMSVAEYLVHLNTEESLLKTHGHYLVQWFKIGQGNEFLGVDYVTAWYNRNLRVFANIQRIVKNATDARALVIMGAGHLPILRHCVMASPEFELVEVSSYL